MSGEQIPGFLIAELLPRLPLEKPTPMFSYSRQPQRTLERRSKLWDGRSATLEGCGAEPASVNVVLNLGYERP